VVTRGRRPSPRAAPRRGTRDWPRADRPPVVRSPLPKPPGPWPSWRTIRPARLASMAVPVGTDKRRSAGPSTTQELWRLLLGPRWNWDDELSDDSPRVRRLGTDPLPDWRGHRGRRCARWLPLHLARSPGLGGRRRDLQPDGR